MLQRTSCLAVSKRCTSNRACVVFKGLGTDGTVSSVSWPAPLERDSTVPADALPHVSSGYVSYRRSLFSVLRSRQRGVGKCVSGMLPTSFTCDSTADKTSHDRLSFCGGQRRGCHESFCCCSALVYQSSSKSAEESNTSDEVWYRLRDDFVLALKLIQLEDLLRSIISVEWYARLVGDASVVSSSRVVQTCGDFLPDMAESSNVDHSTSSSDFLPSSSSPSPEKWVARLLLLGEEDNRLQWLQEESDGIAKEYARAPSLRALLVMWSVSQTADRIAALKSGSAAPPASHAPTMEDVVQVQRRMEDRQISEHLSDVAVTGVVGIASGLALDSFWRLLAKRLKPEALLNACHSNDKNEIRHLCYEQILILSIFLRYIQELKMTQSESGAVCMSSSAASESLLTAVLQSVDEVRQLGKILSDWEDATTSSAPASEPLEGLSRLPNSFTASQHIAASTLAALTGRFISQVFEIAEKVQMKTSSPHLASFTEWLLREMAASPVCYFHFKQLVDRNVTEALNALDRSGVASRSKLDLKVVVRQLLPMIELCGSEDLYSSVLRDVISALEERSRRDGYSFSADDLICISELGTQLFSASPGDGSGGTSRFFDESAGDQMAELHVMDGSPWALCLSTYRSLKEIVHGLVRDQRRLRQQVQEQLRSFSGPNGGLNAVMGGSGTGPFSEHAERGVSSLSSANAPVSADVTTAAAKDHEAVSRDGSAAFSSGATSTSSSQSTMGPAPPPRILVPSSIRQRFLIFVEDLVRAQVDESSYHTERPILISSELFAFVTQHVPVPNIQDEYRRKIFLLVNVAEDAETTRRRAEKRRAERLTREKTQQYRSLGDHHRHHRSNGKRDGADTEDADCSVVRQRNQHDTASVAASDESGGDPHGGEHEIPAELRFLVSSLPLTLSPWASVMILREVLDQSAGRNPRYTYVLNAAIDLQLPISTTRSRIATTLNMWRFLNSQAHKLSLKESLLMRQRCAWNLPMSYILSSYWSLLTWLTLASIILLNVVGLDFESQFVANSLFRMFAPWEEICTPQPDKENWNTQATADLAADYFEKEEISDLRRAQDERSSTNVILSSASYLFLGHDDQRRPMTIIPIGSNRHAGEEARVAEEYAAATAVLRELSLHVPFPFFLDIERPMPVEYVEKGIAERIRRVSTNTWFLPRMMIRLFPLGRHYTERTLVSHTCAQANLTRRRITFLLYIHDRVPVTPQLIKELNESVLCRNANLVLVAHEMSLWKGGTTPEVLAEVSGTRSASPPPKLSEVENHTAVTGVVTRLLPEVGEELASLSSVVMSQAPTNSPIRVLPYCRDLQECPSVFFSRESAVPKLAGLSETRGISASHSASATAETTESSFPPFALKFSGQRASVHRNWVMRMEAVQEGRLMTMRPRWEGWVGTVTHLLHVAWSCWVTVATPASQFSRHAFDHGEAPPTPTVPTQDRRTSTPASERLSSEDVSHALGGSVDSGSHTGGVVAVPFTALKHMLSEVSMVPVPVQRSRRHSATSATIPDEKSALDGSGEVVPATISLSSCSKETVCSEATDSS